MPFELILDTTDIAEQYRINYMRRIFAPIAKIYPINESNIYDKVQIRRVQSVILVSVTARSYCYERAEELVLQSNLDMYMLAITLEGCHSHSSEGKDEIKIKDGDILLIDLAKSCRGITSKGRHLQIYIPKDLLNHQLEGIKIYKDTVLNANKPMTKILKNYMVGLFDATIRLHEKEASVTLYTFLSLLATALKSTVPQNLLYLNDYTKGGDLLKRRVIDFIEMNISNSDLKIEVLTKTFRVSRAHLYRAFHEDGGVVSVIRNKRLHMAYHELLNPMNIRTLTQIAHEYGFSSSNHFYRAFRKRYGFSPNEIKRNQAKFGVDFNVENDLFEHFRKIIKEN